MTVFTDHSQLFNDSGLHMRLYSLFILQLVPTWHLHFSDIKSENGHGGAVPTINSCAINHGVRFLPVKLGTVNLVNILGPGYCSSTR